MSERVVPIARLVSWLTRPGVTREHRGLFTWNIAGKCEVPHVTEFVGHREAQAVGSRVYLAQPDAEAPALRLDLHTPCRKCEPCLRKRARLWRARSLTETQRAVRTWFGTVTLSPESHNLMMSRAAKRIMQQGGPLWPDLAHEVQFAERWREVSRELTLWMKRLRKTTDAPLKYLLVAEAHKSGLPHVHVLIHELSSEKPIRHAALASSWGLGFTKWNLVVEAKQATYLCKYLSKSLAARVRASQAYGARSDDRDAALARLHRIRLKLGIPLHSHKWLPRMMTWDQLLAEHWDAAFAAPEKQPPMCPRKGGVTTNEAKPDLSLPGKSGSRVEQ